MSAANMPPPLAKLCRINALAIECVRQRCAEDPGTLQLLDVIAGNFDLVARYLGEYDNSVLDMIAVAQEHHE